MLPHWAQETTSAASALRRAAGLAFGTRISHDVAADDLWGRLVIRRTPATARLLAFVPSVRVGPTVVLVHLGLFVPHLTQRGPTVLPDLGLPFARSASSWHGYLLRADRCWIRRTNPRRPATLARPPQGTQASARTWSCCSPEGNPCPCSPESCRATSRPFWASRPRSGSSAPRDTHGGAGLRS